MNWLILSIIIGIVGTLAYTVFDADADWVMIVRILTPFLTFFLIVVVAVGCTAAGQEINAFMSQSTYIESHIPEDPVENAALTNTKIGLNSWLYTAQYNNEHFGGWSFYPDAVQDLEPIA